MNKQLMKIRTQAVCHSGQSLPLLTTVLKASSLGTRVFSAFLLVRVYGRPAHNRPMRTMSISGSNLTLMAEAVGFMGLQLPKRTQALMRTMCLEEGKEDWVSSTVLDELYQDLIAQTGRTDFGLQLACNPALARYGILPMLVLHAPSLRVALGDIQKFAALIQDKSELEWINTADACVFRIHPHCLSEIGRMCRSDFAMLALTHALRMFGKGRTGLIRVKFAHAKPAHVDQYSLFFDAPVEFDCPHNELILSRAMLSETMPGADSMLYSACLARANMALAEQRGRKGGLVQQLSQLLLARLHERPRMADVAQCLGYTDRTLRRHLADIGADYQQLLSKLQMERACALLSDGSRSIQQVAADVGFTSVSSFHRAFLRATGVTPNAWRGA